jgi:glutamate racemase
MIIACNTATAYGKPQVKEFCKIAGFNSKVIGVIDAGCLGALGVLDKDEDETIAILATPATVTSMAYLNTLNDLKKGYTGSIPVFQERRKGLHKAIDNKPEFIGASYKGPFLEYQGPSLSGGQYRIHKELLPFTVSTRPTIIYYLTRPHWQNRIPSKSIPLKTTHITISSAWWNSIKHRVISSR